MKLVDCTYDRHAAAILTIFNDAILNSTVIYEYQERSPESMIGWFSAKEAGQWPVIGIEADDGELLGFASFGPFRPHAAFKYSVEHSVYVQREHRGQGIGPQLLRELIKRARQRSVHLLIGGIDADNQTSIALHERLGFIHAGTIRQAGFKFGRWLDLAFYQLTLDTPAAPADDRLPT